MTHPTPEQIALIPRERHVLRRILEERAAGIEFAEIAARLGALVPQTRDWNDAALGIIEARENNPLTTIANTLEQVFANTQHPAIREAAVVEAVRGMRALTLETQP